MPSSRAPGLLTRRDVLRGLAAVSVGTATGTAAHGFFYERHHVEVTRSVLRVAKMPPALAGLRIGFMTDLHRSATVPHELIENAARLLMAEQPDLIVLGGDYVTWGGDGARTGDRAFVEPAADAISGLSAPHGVFGVLGNHDDDRDMPAAMTARNVEMLKDARTRLTIKGEALDLIGIRYWTTRARDIANVARGAASASILLAHNPSRMKEAAALSIPLMLSGHTHGGQIVLPGLGAIAARNFPIISGSGFRDGTTAFVSRGIGTVYVPVRVNCPPEVAVLTIQSQSAAV
jgi:predicted MPP superfamily phosphohydrolase